MARVVAWWPVALVRETVYSQWMGTAAGISAVVVRDTGDAERSTVITGPPAPPDECTPETMCLLRAGLGTGRHTAGAMPLCGAPHRQVVTPPAHQVSPKSWGKASE